MTQYPININGDEQLIAGEASLLTALRDDCNLNSPKYGCGAEQCGGCRVIIDGQPAYACTARVEDIRDARVFTVEGLTNEPVMARLITSFESFNAGQCGYCLSGILISAYHLLTQITAPTRIQVTQALEPHLCRCGAHNRIIKAVMDASQ